METRTRLANGCADMEWQRKKTRGRRSMAVPAVGDIREEGAGDAVASVHWEALHSTRRRWEDQGSSFLRWAAAAATAEPYSSRRVPGLNYENALGDGDKHITGSHIKIRVRMESSPQKTIPISLQRGEDDEIRPRHAPSPPLRTTIDCARHELLAAVAGRRRSRARMLLPPHPARFDHAAPVSLGPDFSHARAAVPPACWAQQVSLFFLGSNAGAAEDIELN
jgi:hypothetical protein